MNLIRDIYIFKNGSWQQPRILDLVTIFFKNEDVFKQKMNLSPVTGKEKYTKAK